MHGALEKVVRREYEQRKLTTVHALTAQMPSAHNPRGWPRGPRNALHDAAADGSTKRTMALISSGSIDINQGTPQGLTPLMYAAVRGSLPVVRILLDKGADVAIATDEGVTALRRSVRQGHLAVTKLLLKAGSDLEAYTDGGTALHAATSNRQLDVMSALIDAGANTESLTSDGFTPLYLTAMSKDVSATRLLLRAKANPLAPSPHLLPSGKRLKYSPLDAAAGNRGTEVVRELIRHVGIEGCGGESGGVSSLELAATSDYLDVMAVLVDAGVVDTGIALITAASCGREASVRFLLRHQLRKKHPDDSSYVNFTDDLGRTALSKAISIARSPRTARLLIDAGADTSSSLRVSVEGRRELGFAGTPMDLALWAIRETLVGKPAADGALDRLEAIRRLLLQVEAVHAVSWLGPATICPSAPAPPGVPRGPKMLQQGRS